MPAKKKQSSEATVREIRRRARRRFSAEEKIRIVLEGLRGEESIAALCRREGIAANLTPKVHEIFRLAKLDSVIPIFDSTVAAVRHFNT